ncbi:10433_t:CDS:2, partial [Ambispora leptoticha]
CPEKNWSPLPPVMSNKPRKFVAAGNTDPEYFGTAARAKWCRWYVILFSRKMLNRDEFGVAG